MKINTKTSINDQCDFYKKGVAIISFATAAAAAVYVPEINSAIKSIFQYAIVSNPSSLVMPIVIGSTLTGISVLLSYCGYQCRKSAKDMGSKSSNPLIISMYFLSNIFYNMGLAIAIICGLITAPLAAVYMLSKQN